MDFASSADIKIPKNPLERIIGQDEAVRIASLVAKQRRNLLLVGPPGTGKSLIAQSIAHLLPKPQQEISVLQNAHNPERPVLEIRRRDEVEAERKKVSIAAGVTVSPAEIPAFAAERLGFRCRRCGRASNASEENCPYCGAGKFRDDTPFGDLLFEFFDADSRESIVYGTRRRPDGKEERVAYERAGEKARILDAAALQRLEDAKRQKLRHVLVPLERSTFVQATGASETELVGDVRHDPYGSHPEIGTPQYMCVSPGAVHEAHEGVLFIDEIANLGYLQRHLLTAMQEKRFPITGRNATSSGASVKVENVPCDFLLVAAINISDAQSVLPPLRSRIAGNGYEVLLKTAMPDTEENRAKFCQFVAQEIHKDGRIPHASAEALSELLDEARRRARLIDEESNALTLRLRDVSGLVKSAGDVAQAEGAQLIEKSHVAEALGRSRTLEEQLRQRYGDSWWKAGAADAAGRKDAGKGGII